MGHVDHRVAGKGRGGGCAEGVVAGGRFIVDRSPCTYEELVVIEIQNRRIVSNRGSSTAGYLARLQTR